MTPSEPRRCNLVLKRHISWLRFPPRTESERKYPQIDLEGLGIDYALYRFRNYIVRSPSAITVVTDHQPLCAVFNGNRTGSIRTERYKQINKDIKFKVVYHYFLHSTELRNSIT